MAESLGSLVAVVGANVKPFNKAMNDMNRNLNKSLKNVDKIGRQMSMAFTAPLGLIAGKGVQVFRDFEFQMAKVQAVSGATGAEFAKLSENAKQLGASTRFTASEVAMLQTEYAKLGFSADEITKVTGATLALAQASDSDLATAAEVAGSTLRAFGMSADETGRVTDVMAASFSSTALDMSSFADAMKYVAPVAKSAGLSIEETTAMLGTLANAGIKGSQAGTALRRIISELGATGGDVAGAIKNLANEGLNLADAKDEVGRSAQSALLILGEGTQSTDDLTKSLQGSAGAAQQMADTMDATLEGSMKKMQSAVEGAQLAIGEALAPAMSGAADLVASLASAFTNMSDTGQTVVMVIGGIAAAIGPAMLVLSQMIKSYSVLQVTITRGVIPALKRMMAFMVANPYMLVAAAVVAVGTALAVMATRADDASKAQQMLNDVNLTAQKSIAGQKVEMERLLGVARDETRSKEERRKAVEALNQLSPEYLGNLSLEKINSEEATAATESYIQALMKKAKIQAAQEKLVEIERQMLEVQAQSGKKAINNLSFLDQQVVMYERLTGAKSHEQVVDEAKAEQTKTLLAQKEALVGLIQQETNVTAENAKATGHAGAAVEAHTASVKSQSSAIKETTQAFDAQANALETLQSAMAQDSGIDFFAPQTGSEFSGLELEDPSMEVPEPELERHIAAFNQANEAITGMNASMDKTVNLGDQIGSTLGNTFGAVIEGSAGVQDAMKAAGKSIFKTLINIAKANAIATFSSPTNPANAATGGLAMPAVIAGGLALIEGLLGAVAFADGGIVSGPTLGLVGEYSGARSNPEVIAPLDKLQGMISDTMQGGPMVLTTKLKGGDIEIAAQSGRRKLGRTR